MNCIQHAMDTTEISRKYFMLSSPTNLTEEIDNGHYRFIEILIFVHELQFINYQEMLGKLHAFFYLILAGSWAYI